jgi:hypothetical protein
MDDDLNKNLHLNIILMHQSKIYNNLYKYKLYIARRNINYNYKYCVQYQEVID